MGAGASCGHKAPVTAYNVGKKYDFKNDSVSEVTVNKSDTILLAKYEGKLYAFGPTCPHYGAPLSKGVFSKGKIRCPWHGACFDIKTGDIEDFPGLDCLPVYKVSEQRDGSVIVFCETELSDKVIRPLGKTKASQKKSNSIVIIGGGVASCIAAQTLRQNKYDGRVVIISREHHLPYDRTLINKMPGTGINDLRLRDMDYYRDGDIEIFNSTECSKVDFKSRKISFRDSTMTLEYDKLLIATGSSPKILEINGANLKNITSIYTIEDAARINQEIIDKEVVIIGGTFIGLELAWALREQYSKITIIGSSEVPMSYLLGKTVGSSVLKQATQNCLDFNYLGPEVVCSFIGNSTGEVTGVLTSGRGTIPADYVILAMWSTPNSDICSDSPEIALDKLTKAIVVDQFLRTSLSNVYAAGDVISFPLDIAGQLVQIPYWNLACQQGKAAALNMMGKPTSISKVVPFYWATFFDMKMRICGHIKDCDEIVVFQDLDINAEITQVCFCALYRKTKVIKGVVTANCDPIASQVASDLASKDKNSLVGYPSYVKERFPNCKPIIEQIIVE